ncbi:ferredoxin [Streptomyces sp. DSM 41524]|uniref:Ferredoxin n=4 Tax=Streptomyces violaceusniger group TaxID=2839105 RepID=A0ABP3ZZB7_9ACTN|nr:MULTISPECIES: ferredoxin [Streptomyces]MBI0376126.1 ferredoxin [Streptomyces albiflaviniger]MEE4591031.1 ferredoxin [Streptomyces sp. DSM 41524]MBA6433000.1 ferredoxin [Streptomyces sp. GMR22]NEW69981.1 ferredoxin [Streptomyces rhizosphaericus]TMU99986.1 ferredoxin [Streptomyces sp. DASNCL29]
MTVQPPARLPDNAAGRFYVNEECTDCDTCRCIAPDFFVRNDAAGYTYLAVQPLTEDDEDAVYEAMDCCPADAICEEE